jgi:hypothetical protein
MIKTEEFLLPAHWAPYLINGDASGYTDDELADIDEWCTACAPGPCLGVADDVEFCWRGDDSTLGADRAVYTFQIVLPVYADGEVIGYALH